MKSNRRNIAEHEAKPSIGGGWMEALLFDGWLTDADHDFQRLKASIAGEGRRRNFRHCYRRERVRLCQAQR